MNQRQELFRSIYSQALWGSVEGRGSSGLGSHAPHLVEPYISALRHLIFSRNLAQANVVDLGCGDFNVGRRIAPFTGRYQGLDIVPEVIARNQTLHAGERVSFAVCDIVNAELPAGDLCLVRQVMQHLSNADVAAVLAKLQQYPLVVITEHQPVERLLQQPNRDIDSGAGIRLALGSGLYLDQPPFNLPARQLQRILSVPVDPRSEAAGVLNTFIYEP